mgnify:CR=1 FL=1
MSRGILLLLEDCDLNDVVELADVLENVKWCLHSHIDVS